MKSALLSQLCASLIFAPILVPDFSNGLAMTYFLLSSNNPMMSNAN